MTKRHQPHTLHELTAFQLGRELKSSDFVKLGPDRKLTSKELSQLTKLREHRAAQARVRPQRLHHMIPDGLDIFGQPKYRMGFEEKSVGYYRRAMVRFERWARRAGRLNLNKAKPPGHIAQKALDVTTMLQTEGMQ